MRIHRYIWALPNTLMGLPFVPLAIFTGGQMVIVEGVLELHSGLIASILRYCVPMRGGVCVNGLPNFPTFRRLIFPAP
jgi:hypothetical protein